MRKDGRRNRCSAKIRKLHKRAIKAAKTAPGYCPVTLVVNNQAQTANNKRQLATMLRNIVASAVVRLSPKACWLLPFRYHYVRLLVRVSQVSASVLALHHPTFPAFALLFSGCAHSFSFFCSHAIPLLFLFGQSRRARRYWTAADSCKLSQPFVVAYA